MAKQTGLELRTYLSKITNKPLGKSYNGDLYRSLSISSEQDFGALPKVLTDHDIYSSWGRYDLDGAENAMYFSKTLSGNQTEITYYDSWTKFSTYKFSSINTNNLLDLTDDVVRKQLGTQFDDLVRTIENQATPNEAKFINYEMINEISTWARNNGYNGLIVPGARGGKDYENIIIFKQSYIDQILSNKIPAKIDK